jgi:hypothetical protein
MIQVLLLMLTVNLASAESPKFITEYSNFGRNHHSRIEAVYQLNPDGSKKKIQIRRYERDRLVELATRADDGFYDVYAASQIKPEFLTQVKQLDEVAVRIDLGGDREVEVFNRKPLGKERPFLVTKNQKLPPKLDLPPLPAKPRILETSGNDGENSRMIRCYTDLIGRGQPYRTQISNLAFTDERPRAIVLYGARKGVYGYYLMQRNKTFFFPVAKKYTDGEHYGEVFEMRLPTGEAYYLNQRAVEPDNASVSFLWSRRPHNQVQTVDLNGEQVLDSESKSFFKNDLLKRIDWTSEAYKIKVEHQNQMKKIPEWKSLSGPVAIEPYLDDLYWCKKLEDDELRRAAFAEVEQMMAIPNGEGTPIVPVTPAKKKASKGH